MTRDARFQRLNAWHIAALQRAKKLPDLKKFVDPPQASKSGKPAVLSQAEIYARLRRISGSPGPPGRQVPT